MGNKWYIVGIVCGERKTVKVTAPDKIEAIKKGMKKLDTNNFVECRLINI